MPFSESLSKQDRMSLAGGSHPQFMHPPAGIANDDIESQLTAVRPDILFLNSRQGSLDRDFETVGRIRRADSRLPLLMSIDDLDHLTLTSLMEKGVTDFVVLPLRPVDLLLRIQRMGRRPVREESVAPVADRLGLEGLLGENVRFREEVRKIRTVATARPRCRSRGKREPARRCARAPCMI